MAITLQNAPGNYPSAHDNIIFTVCDIVKASDPTTYPDYRYICDVYIGSTLVTRMKSYPHPSNKCGLFNISTVIRSYVGATFNPTANVVQAQQMANEEFSILATLKFGEEYGDPIVLTTNLLVDTERQYFNHYNGRLLGVSTGLEAYIDAPATMRSSYTTLTTPTAGSPIYTGNKNSFVPFAPSTGSAVVLRVTSYTDAGATVNTQDISITPSAAKVMQVLNLSPTVLNALYPGLIPLTVASYYTVEFRGAKLIDSILKFKLVCEPKYEVFTLHFLNRFGGWESRDLTKVSRKSIAINKQEFGKLPYTMDLSGVVSYKNANNVYNETRAVYSKEYTEKMILNTDILSDIEYAWLADLVLSPQVYIEMTYSGTVYHIPCVITDTDYDYHKRVNDKLTNLTVKIEFGNQFNTQYR